MANFKTESFCGEAYARLTEEALADIDQNAVIAHEVMLAWAESLDTDNPLPLPQ